MAARSTGGRGQTKASAFTEAIGDFLHLLSVERAASINTVAAYRSDLQQFTEYIARSWPQRVGMHWELVDRPMVQGFVLDLERRGYTQTSVARKVVVVRSFFAFLAAEGAITANPAERLDYPRVEKMLPKAISPSEVDELLEQPARRSTPDAKRDRAMLELLYATGMRVTELVSLNLDDLNLDPRSPCVRCMGKGSRHRTIPIHDHAVEAIRVYLGESRPLLVRDRNESALFVNQRGKRLTRQGFWFILKAYAKVAGLAGGITPQTLRHSFATQMLRGGMPLNIVQKMLGHASVSSTRVYRAS